MTPVILFALLLFIGAAMAFRSNDKDNKNGPKSPTVGLVMFGVGLFALLHYGIPALYAGIAVVAALLAIGWAIAKSPTGMVSGLIAIVIIIVIGLIFRIPSATDVLRDAAVGFGTSSSDLGGIITDWLPKR